MAFISGVWENVIMIAVKSVDSRPNVFEAGNFLDELPERHKIGKSILGCLFNRNKNITFAFLSTQLVVRLFEQMQAQHALTFLNASRVQTVLENPRIIAGCCALIIAITSIR